VDADVPEPDTRHALDDEADPADALPAFEHRMHILAGFVRVLETHNAAPAEYLGLRQRWLRTEALKFPPSRRLICKGSAKVQ
jgi:hypothetical protein